MAKNYQELNLEISKKKIELSKTDHLVLEYVEGLITDEEFEKVKASRAKLRETIAADEKKLPAEKKKYEAELAAKEKEEEIEND